MLSDLPKPKSFSLLKILIVDDNDQMREMVRFYLRDLTFEVSECADGLDAIDCYEKTRPDWVLMDWEMKRMDGLEATRRIIKDYPKARIVIVTQHSDAELRAAAAEAGAAGYMLKDDLLNLRRLLLEDQKPPPKAIDRARFSNDIV